jgi:prophage regulatory protein
MATNNQSSEPNRILRKKEVLKIVGVSATTLWRLERSGRFPKRVALSANCAGWLSSEINDWYRNLSESRDTAANEQ